MKLCLVCTGTGRFPMSGGVIVPCGHCDNGWMTDKQIADFEEFLNG